MSLESVTPHAVAPVTVEGDTPALQPPTTVVRESRRHDVPAFFFDGGAATYVGTGLLAFLVTVVTLGIALPFAIVLRQRWVAKHTYIEGRRLMFTGSGMGLFGNWVKWWLLTLVTLGVYSFWVIPRLTKWKVEHQAFDPRG